MLAFCFAKTPPTCPGRAVSTLHHSLAHLLIKFSTENTGYDRGLYQMSTGNQTKSFELFHSPQRPAVHNINFCLEMTLVSHKLSRIGDLPATNQTGSLPGLTSRLQGRRDKQPPASRGKIVEILHAADVDDFPDSLCQSEAGPCSKSLTWKGEF